MISMEKLIHPLFQRYVNQIYEFDTSSRMALTKAFKKLQEEETNETNKSE